MLKQIGEAVGWHKVIDSDNFDAALIHGVAIEQTPDATKTVNADANGHD
jgi:hypothetical protein